jgi:hypothetical protein
MIGCPDICNSNFWVAAVYVSAWMLIDSFDDMVGN